MPQTGNMAHRIKNMELNQISSFGFSVDSHAEILREMLVDTMQSKTLTKEV